jgi:NAD(P)-dependent dehydrogenase (short-subunit alcohol dehydrogenase family)
MPRIAAVTGGAGGIGTAIANALTDSGHTVAILDKEAEFSVDLGDEESTRACARALLERFGRVDVLVHAAASFERVPLAELDRETLRRVLAVNVESLLWLLQELTPKMAEEGFGRIVAITSDSIDEPTFAPFLPYVISKSALVGAVRVLAHTLGDDGITVNCVSPGLIKVERTATSAPPVVFERELARQAVPRTLEAEDVAATTAFLASDGAAAITGQTWSVNGGALLR